MIFDVAIYLFIYILHFISVLLRPSPIPKTIQKMGERNEKKTLQQQANNYHTSNVILAAVPQYLLGRGGLVVNNSDSGSRGREFEPHSGRRVLSLSKTYLPPKSTGDTQEAVAPSQHG